MRWGNQLFLIKDFNLIRFSCSLDKSGFGLLDHGIDRLIFDAIDDPVPNYPKGKLVPRLYDLQHAEEMKIGLFSFLAAIYIRRFCIGLSDISEIITL